MGVKEGITLIVGGGFHGKSTLLQALQMGVYDHIPGDGRELVVTDSNAVTIRAEDGRSVVNCDISPFISNLPFGRTTNQFSTPDASGSTSQAANILEALEVGAKVLLIDEDTAATNFMVRDQRMMQLVAKDKEPITPFIHKVRALRRDYKVSTVLVIGGCGDYFDVADCVIMQENYAPRDVTSEAKALARDMPDDLPFGKIVARMPFKDGVSALREGDRPGMEKVSVGGKHEVRFGDHEINLHALHQIADKSQTRAIGDAIIAARNNYMDGSTTLSVLLDKLQEKINKEGLDALNPGRFRPKHSCSNPKP
jgi:predicted ABC-class ATPase